MMAQRGERAEHPVAISWDLPETWCKCAGKGRIYPDSYTTYTRLYFLPVYASFYSIGIYSYYKSQKSKSFITR